MREQFWLLFDETAPIDSAKYGHKIALFSEPKAAGLSSVQNQTCVSCTSRQARLVTLLTGQACHVAY